MPSRRAADLSALYVILDATVPRRRTPRQALEAALRAGARLFQYRNKQASMKQAYDEASMLRDLAGEAGAVFIVNDRCDLALAVDADGAHIGQQDLPVQEARRVLGPDKLLGVSTHRPEEVVAATSGGADYLGYGPIFRPVSKADHEPVVGLEGLRRVRSLTALKIFAIGGITEANASDVRRAGADGIAVISAVLDAVDVHAAVSALLRLSSPIPPGP